MHGALNELVIIFGVSAAVVFAFAKLKQPPIAGYLLSGVLLGSHGFSLITDITTIQSLAEIGLIFLLFSIGVEFSFKQLMRIRGAFFIGGLAQFAVTSLLVFVIIYLFDGDWRKALVGGFVVSLSSTAIVFKLLHERREMNTPYGDLSVGVLLFQDMVAVPLLVLLPYLSITNNGLEEGLSLVGLGLGLMKGLGLFTGIYLGARYIVPWALDRIAKTGVRELFLITVALITFGCAILGDMFGLSMAMGAFVAGLMISESQYGHQVLSDLVPLKEPFIALFFVSVGLLLNVQYLEDHLLTVLSITLAVFLIKFIVAATVARLYRLEARSSSLFGILISQIGEFSFVMAGVALSAKLITADDYQLTLSVIVLTMLISPSLIRSAPNFSPHLANLDPFRKWAALKKNTTNKSDELFDHVVIIGYGMNGQNLVNSLHKIDIKYSVIETNAQSVSLAKSRGGHSVFGDGSRPEILHTAGIDRARMVVVAINDVGWISKVVSAIRQVRPDIFLVVRCTYLRDAEALSSFKINELVVGELLTAHELLSRVMLGFGVMAEEDLRNIEFAVANKPTP